MKQVRWRVRFNGKERTYRHFHNACKVAEALRRAGRKAEIVTVESEA